MSGKLKLLLVVLALGALISVSYLLTVIGGSSWNGTPADISTATGFNNCQNTKGLRNCDDDHDGLSNGDESYWATDPNNPDSDNDGFLDGEEVISGHDPRKAGPDDFIDPGQNLTNRTATLTLGGIMSGNLASSSPNYEQNLVNLAQALGDQYAKNTTITIDKFQTVPDTKESVRSFAVALSQAISQIFQPTMQDTDSFLKTYGDLDLSDLTSFADSGKSAEMAQSARRLAFAMGERAARLAAIPVPLSFSPQESSAIQFLRAEQRYYELISEIKSDPLQAGLAFKSLITMHTQVFTEMVFDLSRAIDSKL